MKRLFFLLPVLFLGIHCPLSAQLSDSLKCSADSLTHAQTRLRFTFRQLYVPGAMIVLGSVAELDNGFKGGQLRFHDNHFAHFHTSIDNYLQYSPLVITYGLDALGLKPKNNITNQTAIMLKGELLMYGIGGILKRSVSERRPDGSDNNAFPSGHTAAAFAAAALLSEEFGYRYKWMPYAAYTLASGVGALRVANNKHYVGDVLVGAGIGILSMKIAYWTHQYKWGKKKRPIF
ncbi:MAG TPA: phosphatase PAP2 family protein [Arachidicoccus sp.]